MSIAAFLSTSLFQRSLGWLNSYQLLTTATLLAALLFAGQISGVEGYVEAIATGLMAGMHAATLALGGIPETVSRETASRSTHNAAAHAAL